MHASATHVESQVFEVFSWRRRYPSLSRDRTYQFLSSHAHISTGPVHFTAQRSSQWSLGCNSVVRAVSIFRFRGRQRISALMGGHSVRVCDNIRDAPRLRSCHPWNHGSLGGASGNDFSWGAWRVGPPEGGLRPDWRSLPGLVEVQLWPQVDAFALRRRLATLKRPDGPTANVEAAAAWGVQAAAVCGQVRSLGRRGNHLVCFELSKSEELLC